MIALGCGVAGEAHADGLFVRTLIGPGGLHATSGQGSDGSDFGAGISVAIGARIANRFVLSAEGFYDGGVGIDDRKGMFAVGPSVGYFLAENLYASATLAAARIEISHGDSGYGSDTGYGVNAQLGQGWRVSERWAFGIAAQLFVGSIPDPNTGSWTTYGGMLAFSGTYN